MSKLILDLAKNIRVELNIDQRITFIGGNSGTGRTLLIENLIDAVKNKEVSLINRDLLDRIIVCRDSDDLPHIKNCSNKIVFIDRYDIFTSEEKEKVSKEISRQDSTWIIMTRRPNIKCKYGIGIDSYKELVTKVENGVQVIKTVPI